MDPHVRYIDEIQPLSDNDLYRVRGVEGVDWAVRVYKGSSRVNSPEGCLRAVFLIGLTLRPPPPECGVEEQPSASSPRAKHRRASRRHRIEVLRSGVPSRSEASPSEQWHHDERNGGQRDPEPAFPRLRAIAEEAAAGVDGDLCREAEQQRSHDPSGSTFQPFGALLIRAAIGFRPEPPADDNAAGRRCVRAASVLLTPAAPAPARRASHPVRRRRPGTSALRRAASTRLMLHRSWGSVASRASSQAMIWLVVTRSASRWLAARRGGFRIADLRFT
jgi:hypothetical protein